MNLSGSPLDFLVAFAGGVLMSLTPCVYPLIPLSASIIGISASGSRAKGFVLSFIYVTGIAITYSILGLIASLTGSIFGQISAHPLTYIIFGVLILLFGISMLDIFVIRLPVFFRQSPNKKKGFIGTFVMGLSSGLIISPCVTPVLGSILFYLAAKKQIIYGTSLLFIFAYGMGLILIIAGTFGAFLTNLPKSGKWLAYIKKGSAIILLCFGLYFIYTGIRRM